MSAGGRDLASGATLAQLAEPPPDASRAPVVAGLSQDQPGVVRFALGEAERLKTSVRFVHCHDGPADAAATTVLDRAREVVQETYSAVDVAYALHEGDAGSNLIDEAVQAATVIVGTHDVTWLQRMFGGDVTGRLVASVSCPVVVVAGAFAADRGIHGVVVTLDGDTSAVGPLRYGFEQAEFRDESLHVLHATPVATSVADTEMLIAKVTAEVARCNARTPSVETRLSLTNGHALAECLLPTAHASLLVIGRPHGNSHVFALARPVAMLVLREARCPVAIVPAHYGAR